MNVHSRIRIPCLFSLDSLLCLRVLIAYLLHDSSYVNAIVLFFPVGIFTLQILWKILLGGGIRCDMGEAYRVGGTQVKP